jgi:DNA polymerase sigma
MMVNGFVQTVYHRTIYNEHPMDGIGCLVIDFTTLYGCLQKILVAKKYMWIDLPCIITWYSFK